MDTLSRQHAWLVRLYALALADSRIDAAELALFHRIALDKGVSPEQLDELLLAPVAEIDPHTLAPGERIEILYHAVSMMLADGVADERELAALHECCRVLLVNETHTDELLRLLTDEIKRGTSLEDIRVLVKIKLPF